MPNQVQNVGFGMGEYGAEAADIERRRAYAQALQQQGMTPIGPTEQIGGWAIKQSPTQGLAKMLQSYQGAKGQRDATEEQRALELRRQSDRSTDMSAMAAMLRGTPGQAAIPSPADEFGGGPGAPAVPARPGGQIDPAMLGSLKSPEMQNMGMQMWLQQMQRENAPPTKVDLGDKIGLMNAQGQLVGFLPKGATPDATLREAGSNQRHLTPSGGNILTATTATRGQDLTDARTRAEGAANRGVTMRGQNLTDARAVDAANLGKTPPGYRATPEGGLQAIPGGPADTKLQGAFNQDTAVLTSSTSSMDRLATAANEALNHPGLPGTAGLRGAIPNVPGTQAADAAALLNTLKSQVAFGVLQDMRNNSKTGGALGAVSDAEGKRLEANLAALEKSQSVDQLRTSLKKIIDYTQEAKDRLRDSFNLKHTGKADKNPAYAGPERRAPAGATVNWSDLK